LIYFDDAVKAFVATIEIKASDYKYLFWDSSTLYNNLDSVVDKKVERFLKQSCLFYSTVRNGKIPDRKTTNIGVEGTPFVVKENKIEYIDWLKEEIKEVDEKYGIYYFYGDI